MQTENLRRRFGGAMAFLRRRWSVLRVRAARIRSCHSGPIGLLLAGLCALGAGLYRGWMSALVLVEKLERRCFAALRSLMGFVRGAAAGFRTWITGLQAPSRGQFVALALVLALGCGVYINFKNTTLALQVTLDGAYLGYVRTLDDLDSVTGAVEQVASHHLGSPYQIRGDFDYRLALVPETALMDPMSTAELLLSRIDGIVTEYALSVNGTVVGANRSRMGLTLLKERLLDQRVEDTDSIHTQFVQDIRVEQVTVSSSELLSLSEIRSRLAANRTEAGFYTVAAGDTVSAISLHYGLTLSQVKELNPDLDVDKIGIGDKILVSMAKPMLTVEEVRIESYTEAVPFEVREIGNSSMYVIDSRLIQKGVEGAADVTARVVYHNGVEARREILTYTVVEEPTPQIKEVGTKSLPAWWPTGTFIHPCPGYVYISSNFGYRKSFGDNHSGIDLAANSGTPIYAADGGTVKVASRNGNYGLVVYIDHGNGYVTRYAHCSKLLVKVGQKVAQGEKIALVGSTGKSTGPHLHFEIRYNGTAKNPKNYLDF